MNKFKLSLLAVSVMGLVACGQDVKTEKANLVEHQEYTKFIEHKNNLKDDLLEVMATDVFDEKAILFLSDFSKKIESGASGLRKCADFSSELIEETLDGDHGYHTDLSAINFSEMTSLELNDKLNYVDACYKWGVDLKESKRALPTAKKGELISGTSPGIKLKKAMDSAKRLNNDDLIDAELNLIKNLIAADDENKTKGTGVTDADVLNIKALIVK